MAQARGYDATHVTYIGHRGTKDWDLKPIIINGDWTFVTKNSIDFRGPANQPGTKGQYADVELHAGLICLNGPGTHRDLDLDGMIELFEAALDDLQADPDLINKVLEVTMADAGIDIVRYGLPA